jgi:uncharacterized protein with ParB-like and HNH nuclease domain
VTIAENQPVVDPIPLGELFSVDNKVTCYVVPPYQRDYAWETENVSEFITDLVSFDAKSDSYYLLGQIIVVPERIEKHYDWALVDGQQRTTTIALLFLAMLNVARKFEYEKEDKWTKARFDKLNSIFTTVVNQDTISRLKTSEGGNATIEDIYEQKTKFVVNNVTQKNILANYEYLYEFLEKKYETLEDLIEFLDVVEKRVYLIRLVVESDSKALEIFETINNRGRTLNSPDLMKNLLFQEVDGAEYKKLSKIWDDSSSTMYQIKPRSAGNMEFLMKALVAAKTGDSVRKAQVFRTWKKILRDNKSEVELFKKSLGHKSDALKRITKDQNPLGTECEWLKSIKFFGAIQPYTVLLAGSHLNPEPFERLAELVEARTVLSLLTKERSQDFERLMPKWAYAVAHLPEDASAEFIFEASSHGLKDIEALLDIFTSAMPSVTYRSASDKRRIQYVLARATQVADRYAKVEHPISKLLAPKGKRTDDVDHIFATARGEDPAFVGLLHEDVVDSIGNLALLNSTDNRSSQAIAPLEKESAYACSQYVLAQVLARPAALPPQTPKRITEALDAVRIEGATLDNWGAEAIALRAKLYVKLVADDLRRVCKST